MTILEKFKTEFELLRNRISNFIQDYFQKKEDEARYRKCDHWFRASLWDGKPAKQCEDCGLTVGISKEEFFATFGEKAYSLLQQVMR